MRNVGNFVLKGNNINSDIFVEKLSGLDLEPLTEYCIEARAFNINYELPRSFFDWSIKDSVLINTKPFMFIDYEGVYNLGNSGNIIFSSLFGCDKYTKEFDIYCKDGYIVDEEGLVFHDVFYICVIEI